MRRAFLGAAAVLAIGAAQLACSPRASTETSSSSRARLVTALARMSIGRSELACAVLPSGKILAAGGAWLSSAETYDPSANAWSPASSMSHAHASPGFAKLADGRVLVVGGATDTMSATTSVEIFDPTSGSWSQLAPLGAARTIATVIPLDDGTILAMCGQDAVGNALATVERYDPKVDRWDPGPQRPFPGVGRLGWAKLADGRIFTLGGHEDAGQIFDPRTSTWTATGKLAQHHQHAAVVALANGKLLVAGGADDNDVGLSSTEIFDPATAAFTQGPALGVAHAHAWAGVVAGGTIVVGGAESAIDLVAADGASVVAGGFLLDQREDPCVVQQGGGVVVIGGMIPTPGGSNDSAERITVAAEGSACKSDVECATGWCDPAAKTCAKRPTAEAGASPATPSAVRGSAQHCVKDAECASGHCADGVCCESACTDRCHSCALPSAPGRCALEPAGVDLRGECGAARTCTGTCDGLGACIGATAGSQCAPSRCVTSTQGVGPATCTATGARCPTEAAVAFDCAPYACDPAFGACRSDCATSADCAGGNVCDPTSRTCVSADTGAGASSGGCALDAPGAGSVGAAALLAMLVASRIARRS